MKWDKKSVKREWEFDEDCEKRMRIWWRSGKVKKVVKVEKCIKICMYV